MEEHVLKNVFQMNGTNSQIFTSGIHFRWENDIPNKFLNKAT